MSIDAKEVSMNLYRRHEATVDVIADATVCFLRDVGLVLTTDDQYRLKEELMGVLSTWVRP